MQVPNARWLASQNPCTSTIGWWTLNLTHRGIFNWLLIYILKAIQRVWMSWGTDSSHWMATSLARWALRSQWPDPEDPEDQSNDLGKYDSFWYNVRFCIKFAENWNVSWHFFHCIPRIHESAALSLIMTGTWSQLSVSNNSGQFEVHLLNSNAPNFNSWIVFIFYLVLSRISFNLSIASAPVSMSST